MPSIQKKQVNFKSNLLTLQKAQKSRAQQRNISVTALDALNEKSQSQEITILGGENARTSVQVRSKMQRNKVLKPYGSRSILQSLDQLSIGQRQPSDYILEIEGNRKSPQNSLQVVREYSIPKAARRMSIMPKQALQGNRGGIRKKESISAEVKDEKGV